jgi:hypothetical protein
MSVVQQATDMLEGLPPRLADALTAPWRLTTSLRAARSLSPRQILLQSQQAGVPVAGLDAAAAQALLFALKQALGDGPEVCIRGGLPVRLAAPWRCLSWHSCVMRRVGAPEPGTGQACCEPVKPGGAGDGPSPATVLPHLRQLLCVTTVARAVREPQAAAVGDAWVSALQLAQLAADRYVTVGRLYPCLPAPPLRPQSPRPATAPALSVVYHASVGHTSVVFAWHTIALWVRAPAPAPVRCLP